MFRVILDKINEMFYYMDVYNLLGKEDDLLFPCSVYTDSLIRTIIVDTL